MPLQHSSRSASRSACGAAEKHRASMCACPRPMHHLKALLGIHAVADAGRILHSHAQHSVTHLDAVIPQQSGKPPAWHKAIPSLLSSPIQTSCTARSIATRSPRATHHLLPQHSVELGYARGAHAAQRRHLHPRRVLPAGRGLLPRRGGPPAPRLRGKRRAGGQRRLRARRPLQAGQQ